MKFWDYTKEEREEWRKQDITKAYLAHLEQHRLELMENVLLGASRGPEGWRTNYAGGVIDGLFTAHTFGKGDL